MESIQYNTSFAIISAIRGTLKEKLYEELVLESLQYCQWFKKYFNELKVFFE